MSLPVIYQGDRAIQVSGWTVSESVWSYCAEVTMTVVGSALTSPVWYIDEGRTIPFIAVRVICSSMTDATYVSWPKAYYDLCCSMSSPVNLKGSILDLCNALALPFATPHESSALISLRWVLGAMRGRMLFDTLVKGAACTGGGCATMSYNIGGSLQYVDLLAMRSVSDSAFSFMGQMEPVSSGMESGSVAPGAIDFWFDDESGPADVSRVTFLQDVFVGGYHSYLASSELRTRREWVYRNNFWRTYVRGRSCRFSGVTLTSGILLSGVPCSYVGTDGSSVRYICTGYTNELTGGASNVTLECYSFVEE